MRTRTRKTLVRLMIYKNGELATNECSTRRYCREFKRAYFVVPRSTPQHTHASIIDCCEYKTSRLKSTFVLYYAVLFRPLWFYVLPNEITGLFYVSAQIL